MVRMQLFFLRLFAHWWWRWKGEKQNEIKVKKREIFWIYCVLANVHITLCVYRFLLFLMRFSYENKNSLFHDYVADSCVHIITTTKPPQRSIWYILSLTKALSNSKKKMKRKTHLSSKSFFVSISLIIFTYIVGTWMDLDIFFVDALVALVTKFDCNNLFTSFIYISVCSNFRLIFWCYCIISICMRYAVHVYERADINILM